MGSCWFVFVPNCGSGGKAGTNCVGVGPGGCAGVVALLIGLVKMFKLTPGISI